MQSTGDHYLDNLLNAAEELRASLKAEGAWWVASDDISTALNDFYKIGRGTEGNGRAEDMNPNGGHTPEGYPDYDPESKTWTVGQADSSGTLSWDEAMYLPDDTVPNSMADRTELYLKPPSPSRRTPDPTAHSPYQMTHSGARTYSEDALLAAFMVGVCVGIVLLSLIATFIVL